MKIKADFHIHTHYSDDGRSSASEIIDHAKRAGLDVLGITDHNTTKGALEVRGLAKGSPLVLVGQEVRTESGEIIVFGPEKDIPKKMSLIETCKMAKSMEGFIIVPHPFDKTRHGLGENMLPVIEYLDAIEAVNSRCLFRGPNIKAETFARKNNLPVVSGSDAHTPNEIGNSFTELDIEGKLNEKAVFDALTRGKTKIHSRQYGFVPGVKVILRRMMFHKW